MKKKFLIAISLVVILALTPASLALADHESAADVIFITDLPASCQVYVLFYSYIDPITHEQGSIPGGTTPDEDGVPLKLATAPLTPVTFIYDSVANCSDGTYNFISVSPSNPVTSGASGAPPTVVTGQYLPGSDTTPPVLTLPSELVETALTASGAPVDFTVTANDDVDGPVPVICSHISGSTFPIGTTTVNCSATDSSGNTAYGSFTVTVQYATGKCKGVPGHQILQPINADDSSVFKAGSVVPAKFRVCGADGISIGTPGLVSSFRLIQIISNGIATNVDDEAISSATPDTAFRFGNRQWIFNINTKKLNAGNTYVYRITLNDGSTIQFQFSLK